MITSTLEHEEETNTKAEEHKPEPWGIWCNLEIYDFIEAGKITSSEAILIQQIGFLSKLKGEGCWASNAYLANKLNVKPRQIQKMVQNLKLHRLVIQTGTKIVNGQSYRVLETRWTKAIKQVSEGASFKTRGYVPNDAPGDVPNDIQSKKNTSYSSIKNETHRRGTLSRPRQGVVSSLNGHTNSQNLNGTNSQDLSKVETGTKPKLGTRLLSNHQSSSSPKTLSNTKTKLGTNSRDLNGSSSKTLNGIKPSSTQEFDGKCATRLFECLTKYRKIMRRDHNHKKWLSSFTRLRHEIVNTERIDIVLTWYIKHFTDDYMPKAYSAETFYKKFVNIEDAMFRKAIKSGVLSKDRIYSKNERFLYNDYIKSELNNILPDTYE